MSFVHEQSGIYRRTEDGRYHLFVRWYTARRRYYQVVDFNSMAEASCFLMAARTASRLSERALRYETITPAEYEEHLRRRSEK